MTTGATVVLVGPVVTAMVAAMLATNGMPVSEDVKSFTAFAMLGAAVGVAFCYFLLDRTETRSRTAARFIIGAMLGVLTPRAAQKYIPWVRDFLTDPLLVVGSGFICSFVAYFIWFSAAQKLAGRAPAIADSALKAGEIASRIDLGTKEDK